MHFMEVPRFIPQKLLGLAAAALTALTIPSSSPEGWQWLNYPAINKPAESFPELWESYYELWGYPVKHAGSFQTEHSTSKWFNLTNAAFNPTAARSIIDYFERLAREGFQFSYRFRTGLYPSKLVPMPIEPRMIILKPVGTPPPLFLNPMHPSGTIWGIGQAIMYVTVYEKGQKIPFFTDIGEVKYNTLQVFTEACNASTVAVSDTAEFGGQDRRGQEVICTSFGMAFLSKGAGLPYAEYAEEISNTPGMQLDLPALWSTPFHSIPQKVYENMPRFSKVFVNY